MKTARVQQSVGGPIIIGRESGSEWSLEWFIRLFAYRRPAGEVVPADTAMLTIHTPADAAISVNGVEMKYQRRPAFPGFLPGRSFSLVASAESIELFKRR